jgi:ubiquinone biosynthesis protein COQ4
VQERDPARRPQNRIRPVVAWRALRQLIRDPDDTAKVFLIIDALSGNTGERLLRRFRTSETGRRILSERRDVVRTLGDRDALRALPEGSLGRSYAEFMSREKLSPDGLVEASQWEGRAGAEDPDRVRFGARMRDTHDLWHVVTGYDRDLIGEASLLSFTFAQTRNPGIGLIVAMAYWLARGEEGHARRMIREAHRRGRRAAWLPAADWEALLARPLDEVRRELRVGDPPSYRQVRSLAGQSAAAG